MHSKHDLFLLVSRVAGIFCFQQMMTKVGVCYSSGSVLSLYCIDRGFLFRCFRAICLFSTLQYLAKKYCSMCCRSSTVSASGPYSYHRAMYFILLAVQTFFKMCFVRRFPIMHALISSVSSLFLQLFAFCLSLSWYVFLLPGWLLVQASLHLWRR